MNPTMAQAQDAMTWLEAAHDAGDYTKIPLPLYDVERAALSLLGFPAGAIRVYNAPATPASTVQLNSARAHWSRHLHPGQTYAMPSQAYFDALYSDIQSSLHDGAMTFAGYVRKTGLGAAPIHGGNAAAWVNPDGTLVNSGSSGGSTQQFDANGVPIHGGNAAGWIHATPFDTGTHASSSGGNAYDGGTSDINSPPPSPGGDSSGGKASTVSKASKYGIAAVLAAGGLYYLNRK